MAASAAESLIVGLYESGAFRFDGPFTLKSGIESPFYLDLRVLISRPALLSLAADAMWAMVEGVKVDVLCGVPYTALPIATAMSIKRGVPMIMKRKEAKAYGTKKSIEGILIEGQSCLIIEDLVTSGLSVFETIEPIRENGLKVNDVCVILDREQGGRANITRRGIRLHAIATISDVMRVLAARSLITPDTVDKVRAFIANNQVPIGEATKSASLRMRYSERSVVAANIQSRKLLQIMDEKRTNLCLSADVVNAAELVALADSIGPHICMLKTHVDILVDFTPALCDQLRDLARRHRFLIWEDRKFADIGNTVSHQFAGGIYRIAHWADMTNAHSVSGGGVIDGLQQAVETAKGTCLGIFMLAEMSSAGNLCTGAYSTATIAMGEVNPGFVGGFVSMRSVSTIPGMVHVTPGVQLQDGIDSLGQRYQTPERVIAENGSDVIIVGRGIIASTDPVASAIAYRNAGWNAYEKRIA